MSPATVGESIFVTPPEPGTCVLACAKCKGLTHLADLEWDRDVPVNVVAPVICRKCAP